MNRLRELRLWHKLTLKELEEHLNNQYLYTTLGKMERGERSLTDTDINILCDYFKVSSDYLLCRTDNPTPELDIIHMLSLKQRYLIDSCESLSEEQYKELIKYLELMKLRDSMKRGDI